MTKKVTHTKTCCSASFLIPSGFCSSRRVRICCASTTVKIASKVNFSCMDGSIKKVWTTGAGSACVVVLFHGMLWCILWHVIDRGDFET